MSTVRERIIRFISQERLGVIVGLLTVLVAGATGLMMGGVALLGAVGVLVVITAFALMAWRNRRGRVVGLSLGGVLVSFGVAAVAVLLVIQLVPYGRAHSNPAVTGEPAWSSPQTRELMVNACFGCHSNEVEWPWYSNVAPISWVVTMHVDEGREAVNYSEFATRRGDADETIEVIREGEMPPGYYTVLGLHPEAVLTDAEIADLVAGLRDTPGLYDD
jgi:hypothetical protein